MRFVAGLKLLRIKLFEASDTRFTLALAAFRIRAHPFELGLNGFLMSRLLLCFGLQSRLFGFEPIRVIAFVRHAMTAVELENPTRCIIKKIAIVSNRDNSTGVVLEKALHPSHALSI